MHGSDAVFGDVVAWRIVVFSACVLVGSPPTWANDGSNLEPSAPMQAQPWFSSAWRQITDPGGLRSRLEQAGLQFTFSYYGDAFGNPSGGVQQGLSYSGRFSTIVDADLEKLVAVSGIGAPTSSRRYNLCLYQNLGRVTNLRLGQITAAQEFLVSQN